MTKPTTPKWGPIKKQLSEFSQAGLLALIKDLYDYSPENRAFLAARFAAGGNETAALEEYRERIIKQFFPTRGSYRDPKLREARQAIREYRKATADVAGTIDLMLTYVEAGTRFTNEYGDLWEAFYTSLESVLDDVVGLLNGPEGAGLYPQFRERLLTLKTKTQDSGWGYHDYVAAEVDELEERLGER